MLAGEDGVGDIEKVNRGTALESLFGGAAVAANVADSHAGNDISFRAVDPVDVRVRHLSISVGRSPTGPEAVVAAAFSRRRKKQESNTKTILNDVSADMSSGTLTAIIGSSGSGKTSMLNAMSKRMHGRRVEISGNISFHGPGHSSSIRTAYVLQQDVLIPTLSVRETLRYSADLRLPSSVTAAERRRVVEEVILELGLKDAADTRIGNNIHRGCSGGEKRRTSIGVQVQAPPGVICWNGSD